MNALELIGIAANLMFFVIVIAGVLSMLDERKINLFTSVLLLSDGNCVCTEYFLDHEVTYVSTNSNWNYPDRVNRKG